MSNLFLWLGLEPDDLKITWRGAFYTALAIIAVFIGGGAP